MKKGNWPGNALPGQRVIKLLIRMKLAAIIIFGFALQSSATVTYSQQRISLDLKNVSVQKVLKIIENRSDYRFVYGDDVFQSKNLINVYSRNATIDYVMEQLLAGTELSYKKLNENLVIVIGMEKEQTVTFPIKGTITDELGAPLSGVSIVEKGTTIGAVSDDQGKFSIEVSGENVVLEISRVGYETKEIVASGSQDINITLTPVKGSMEEVVVVGYGTQRRENVTGAVSQVQMDKVLGDRPVTSLGAALQGAMAGFTTSSSVVPGAGNSFNIRGVTSINGGAPLILVDNVVQNNLYLLNPNDIETVTVLKDAASAAIYGARASFGVVLITTKKGKKNESLSIDYSNNFGFSTVINRPKMATPLQTVQGLKDMGYAAYWSGQNIDTWLNLLEEYQTNPSKYPLGWTDVNGTKYFLKQTDLIGEMLDNYGFKQMHNISARGGSQNISYRLALGQMNENGILITNKDAFKRTNVSSNVDGRITNWLSTSLDAKYSTGVRSYPNAGWHNQFWNTNLPSYHPNDSLPYNGVNYAVQTPKHAIENASKQTWKTNDIRLFSRTVLKPFKGLDVNFEYTYQHSDANNKRYNNYFVLHQGLQDALNPSDQNTEYHISKELNDYTSINAYANYTTSISGNHNLGAVVGFNQEESNYEQQWSKAFQMISNELPFLGGTSGATPVQTGDAFDRYTLRGAFGRFTYNYAQKYFLELNGRYDLSSKFPEVSRSGFFPSLSVGWNLAKENFMSTLKPTIQTLKLRGSYGELGNQNVINYGFLSTMSPYDANWIYRGARPKTLSTPGMVRANYTWEKVNTLNGGLDFGVLRNRLTGSFDIYRRNTIGMLAPGMDFPAVAGATAPYQNAADLITRGWEIAVNWAENKGDFSYGLGFNLYNSKTFITKYRNENKVLGNYYEGMEIGEIWGYVTDGFYVADDFNANGTLKDGVVSINGVISHEGDIKYKNLRDGTNSTNRIDNGANTVDDPGDRQIIGNNAARYNYGANGFAGWKGLNLSFILQGVAKRDAWIGGDIMFPHAGQFSTFFAHQLDYWTPENKNAYYGRIYQNAQESHGANQRVQTKFLQNAAYMRVKNITLAYSLPQTMISKINLKGVRVFYSGEDLFTISKLIPGIDPEDLSWTYPHYKTHSLGLSITL